MDISSFLELCVKQGYQKKHLEQFQKALNSVSSLLSSKKRLAGDSFLEHNLRVGAILVEQNLAAEVVLAGILYGLPEKISEIQKIFGEEVKKLLDGMYEIKELRIKNNQLEAESLRKIILTTTKDLRVIFIKLANKIDNLRTVHVFPQKEQNRLAEEVLEVYAPLANRLGMEKIKNTLEDLALRIINPRKYQEISNFLKDSAEERQKNVSETIELIKSLSEDKVEIIKIKGRPKSIYSIYKKITNRKVKLDQQYDLLGIRIIVPSEKDCYTILGLLHEKFEPLEGRLKDYIANPKPNFYRSIHTGIQLPNGKTAEIQIRTPEMDEFAEEGLAAHWSYKGIKSDAYFEKKVAWLRNILDLSNQSEQQDFLETIKVDIFGDKIYCYTPKGDVKELPHNAAVLDFAYHIHEEVGNHAVGARVNGKFVPLKFNLHQGDVVEIITSKNQRPRRTWIKIVKSSDSRQKIRKSLREHEKLAPFHYRLLKPIVKEEQGLLVESSDYPTALCALAKCCYPIPGDTIIGIVTKRRVISVHRTDCRAAIKEENRWVKVNWKSTFNQMIQFYVRASERSGILADLLHTIAHAGFEVKEAKAKMIAEGKVECSFVVIPRDFEQIKYLVQKVQKVRGVTQIYFD